MNTTEKLEMLKKQVEKVLNRVLVVTYNSVEDDNPDEISGHFLQCEFKHPPVKVNEDYPIILCIYADSTFQFWRDATPYPSLSNTKEEKNDMLQCLNQCPTLISKLTEEDLTYFVSLISNDSLEYIDD